MGGEVGTSNNDMSPDLSMYARQNLGRKTLMSIDYILTVSFGGKLLVYYRYLDKLWGCNKVIENFVSVRVQ